MFFIRFCTALAFILCADGIRLLDIIVPHQVGSGQDIQLKCNFILEGHKLYSVKWFKGEKEFFRVVPNETPRTRVFPVSALAIDMANSNESMVSIRNVRRANAGTYRCEVSGEAPDFETDYREANMSVIDLPLQGPIIVNVQQSYQPGELVALNCTSSASNPMAVLKWYIDGQLAPDRYVRRYSDGSLASGVSSRPSRRISKLTGGAVGVATVGLVFSVDRASPLPLPQQDGKEAKNVTCVAQVGDIYKSSTLATLSVSGDRHQMVMSGTTTIQPPSHLHASGGGWMHSAHLNKWIWLLSLASLHCVRVRIDSSGAG